MKTRAELNEYRNDYYERYPWARTFSSIKCRCNNKINKVNKSYKNKGIKNYLTIEDVKQLWFRDKACELQRPSIDRIDNNGNYTLDNCRFIELSENIARSKIGKPSPNPHFEMKIVQMDMDGKKMRTWKSQREAAKRLGLNQCGISRCIAGKRNHCGYFKWARLEVE